MAQFNDWLITLYAFFAEESDEDEFFDCDDSLNIDDIKKLQKPAGRLKKNGRLRLLKTGEPMYIPITQVRVKIILN